MRPTIEFRQGQATAIETILNAARQPKCMYADDNPVAAVRANLIKTADEHPNAEYANGIMSIVLRVRACLIS